eukprot:symbB.v1.2.006936.t1/scaffold400.1/size211454/15
MLRIQWMSTGEDVISVDRDVLVEPSCTGIPILAIKRYLQGIIGQPRFKQRLLFDRTILDDSAEVTVPLLLHLVVLSDYCDSSPENRRQFMYAVMNNRAQELERMLSEPQDPNTCGHHSETAMHCVVAVGSVECCKLLVEAEADLERMDRSGAAPLHLACCFARARHLEIAQLLLDAKAKVDVVSPRWGSPLWVACRESDPSMVELLLSAGADKNQVKPDGQTPLYAACEEGDLECACLLVEAKADLNTAPPLHGCTPLWTAASNDWVDITRLLLTCGADHNKARREDGATPLFIAAKYGHLEVVTVLLEHGAQEHATDSGLTPLFVACQEGQLEVARALVLHRANIDIRRHDGATPLLIASRNGYPNIVAFLLETRADTSVTTFDGRSPVWMASHGGHTEVLQLLVRHHPGKRATATESMDFMTPLPSDDVLDPPKRPRWERDVEMDVDAQGTFEDDVPFPQASRAAPRAPAVAMQSEKVDKIVDSLKELTLLEASELVKAIEETFDVDASASAGAVVMAAPAGGGEEEAAPEKTDFDLVLKEVPKEKKIAVIKAIRSITGLGLKEAKGMADNPGKLIEGKPKDICEDAKKQLEEAGAKADIE